MKKSEKIIRFLNSLTFFALIFLFTYTGISKLADHNNFETTLMQSPAIRSYASVISWLIPMTELFVVLLILTKKYRQTGYLLSLALMVTFTIYIGYMVLYTPHLPCSCGGILKELSWSGHLLFNSFFIVLIIISMLSNYLHKDFIAINRISRKPV